MNDRKTDPGRLLTEFSPSSPAEWRAAAEKLIKGAPFEQKLITRTPEGIDLQPIYNPPDGSAERDDEGYPGFPPFRRGTAPSGHGYEPWRIAQEFPYLTPEEFNTALRSDIDRGQNAISIRLDDASRTGADPDEGEWNSAGAEGLSVSSVSALDQALAGVSPDRYPALEDGGAAGPFHVALMAAFLRKRQIPSDRISGTIGADPLGHLARTGTLPAPLGVLFDEMAMATTWAHEQMPGVRTIVASGEMYHDSGASAVEELGCVLATGAEYLRALVSRGVAIETAARHVSFSLGLGTRFFTEIAKLRAAREVWTAVVTAFGGPPEAAAVAMHTRTSRYTMTTLDPYVNMLRTTTEALAGAIGGCDSMHAGFFDQGLRMPDDFSRRIARNTQVLLQAESHVHRVIDPAGGSWYVEQLTDEIAARAWALFQEIERQGGMAGALTKGFVQRLIEGTAAARAEAVALRTARMIGVTAYANPAEQIPGVPRIDVEPLRHHAADAVRTMRDHSRHREARARQDRLSAIQDAPPARVMEAIIAAAAAGATIGELSRSARTRMTGGAPAVTPLPARRLSSEFEELRREVSLWSQGTGSPPVFFLANMGPVKQHKARADFSAGFLAAGGCSVINPAGFSTPGEAANAAIQSGARAMVICSTDETYPEVVPALCAAAKAGDPGMMIVLAGHPRDHEEEFRKAGVDEFIHIKANALHLLRSILSRMGVRS